jgi:ABC-type multidrug transport system fused ATPase/permease subunit
MTSPDSHRKGGRPFATDLRFFLVDFASFAGRKGVFAAILVAFGAVLEGLSLVLIVPLLGIVIGSGLPSGRLGREVTAVFQLFEIERPIGQLTLLLAVFGVLMIVRAVVLSVRDMAVVRLRTTFVEAQRLRIAEHLAAAQWDQVVRLRHARITQLISGDIQRIGLATNFVLQSTVSAAMLLAQCILVFVLAPALASMALVFLLVSAIAFVPIIRRAHDLGGIITDANLSLLDSTTQFLGGLKLAVSQNQQTSFIAEFRRSLIELTRRQIEYTRQQTNSRLALSTVSAFAGGLLVLVGFGAFQIAPPTLITLLLIIARMSGPVAQIQQGVQMLAHALPVYERVTALEQELAAIPQGQSGNAHAMPVPEGPIVFENVGFRHAADGGDAGSVRGVRGVSLVIKPGEFVGLTGPSGAGKTTFADLLVGLYPPEEGRIAVAGVALDGAALASWRDRVSYISQDPFLFHDTVRHNLAWANPQASETDMWNALARVGADELVRRMERGLETVVGERGTLVSGGERQRIALARAILRKPRLLVLDEATSAIDVSGERDILMRLRALTPPPTIVTIAHRAESLALCDRVLRLEAGRCVGGDEVVARD